MSELDAATGPDDVQVVRCDPRRLAAADYNPRTITEHEMSNIVQSMSQYGFLENIVVNRRVRWWPDDEPGFGTETIISGHQRVQAAIKAGIFVEARFLDVSPAEERQLNIHLNRSRGSFDDAKLRDLVANLRERAARLERGANLDATGLTRKELSQLADKARLALPGVVRTDEITERAPERVTPGDLWLLGGHRLLCGDCTKQADRAVLFDGVSARMALTDPPYGVQYDGHEEKRDDLASDLLAQTDFYRKLCDGLLEVLEQDAPFYLFGPSGGWKALDLLLALRESGLQFKQLLVWEKDSFVQSFNDYPYQHEPMYYGYSPGPGSPGRFGGLRRGYRWYGTGGESSIFKVARGYVNKLHPTQKPVALLTALLKNSSQEADVVTDLCAGSGSTLIACEQMGRLAYCMEIAPRYCDTILLRWEQQTGKEAARG